MAFIVKLQNIFQLTNVSIRSLPGPVPGGYRVEELIVDRPPDLGLVPLGRDAQQLGHRLQAGSLLIGQGAAGSVGVQQHGVGLAF